MKQTLCFWDSEQLAMRYGDNVAFIEKVDAQTRSVSYNQLNTLVIDAKKRIKAHCGNQTCKQLIMLVAHHNIDSAVYYLAALQLQHVVWWVEKAFDSDKLKSLQLRYGVNLFINSSTIQQLVNVKSNATSNTSISLHHDLALLITTSGSTGSPTLVKLSYQNINSNCHAICEALSLQTSDMTISTLPLQYSFGLSILNTHLCVGSTIVLTEASLMSRDFWSLIKEHAIKCLYGVPYTFEMLLKLSLARLPLNQLRFMAVAGGKLTADKVTLMNDYCVANNNQFYVMYGQTEASARLTVLAANKALNKPYSIGQAIAGKLWLEDPRGKIIDGSGNKGELCYQGDNVMMGLAQQQSDLALPSQTSLLHTGDIAMIDDEGDYQIVGRLKRFIKILGHRINLDEVEAFFASKHYQVLCTGEDDMIACYLCSAEKNALVTCQSLLNAYLSIHANYSQWLIVDEFPHLSSGKLDYQQLDRYRITKAEA